MSLTREKFTIEIERETDGRFIAEIPQVPGAMAYGATFMEAITKAITIAGAEKVLNRDEVLAALRNVSDVPAPNKKIGQRRTIYEGQNGNFYLDYAAYSGGRTEQVPLSVIRELESEELIAKAYPNSPKANAWILKSDQVACHEQARERLLQE